MDCELTILMPCLNEAETLAICIRQGRAFLRASGVVGEVVIADNGSTDGSQRDRRSRRARASSTSPEKGYGARPDRRHRAARGRYVDHGRRRRQLRLRAARPLRRRAARRRRPGHGQPVPRRHRARRHAAAAPVPRQPGALARRPRCSSTHRSATSTAACAASAATRSSALGLRTTGMEFASEMVVKAVARRPATSSRCRPPCRKDGRSRPPHLRSWRDGWRHLRFLLLYSPRWLFLYPGLVADRARPASPPLVADRRPGRDRQRRPRRRHDDLLRRASPWSATRPCCSRCW